MADAIVLGIKLGTTGLAAISLVLPVYMINSMLAHALGLGGSIRFSRLLSQGKQKEAAENFNIILQGAILLGAVIAVAGSVWLIPLLSLLGTGQGDGGLFIAARNYLQILVLASPLFYVSNILNYYLRNDDRQKLAGIGSAAGNITDIVMNIVLVLFVQAGTRGAVLATVIGQVISILVYLWGVTGKTEVLVIKKVSLPIKELVYSAKMGMTSSIQYLFQLIFLLVCNNILMRTAGETGVAILDIIQNTSYLVIYLYEGTARAMQPLISTYHGEYNEAGKKDTLRLGFIYGSSAGLSVAVIIFLFPEMLCGLFGLNHMPERMLACQALRIYCPAAIMAGSLILISGYYQFCEQERETFTITVLRGFLILIPCTLLFAAGDITVFWWLFPVTEAVTLICYGIKRQISNNRPVQIEPERVYGSTIKSNENEIMVLTGTTEAFCKKWGADVKQQYFITMAVEEICMAILKKGFGAMSEGQIQITLIALPDQEFKLHIRDNAIKFNPFSLETKKVNEAQFDMDAMGMKIIKETAKEFFYRSCQGFNTVIIKF